MRLDRGAFRLDHGDVTHGEVLAASLVGGSLQPLLQRVASRHAAAQAARDRGLEVAEDELQDAFDAWRQDRDLIAAEELERWLEHHRVSVEDVAEFLEVSVLCDRLGEVDLELGDEGEAPELPELLDLVPDEALFSGELNGLVEAFALRACAPDPAIGDDARLDAARRWLLAEGGFSEEAAFVEAARHFEVGANRARWVLDRELAYRMHLQDVLTQEALRQGLAELREDLRRYEIASAAFFSEDVAREVACCVREDKDSFSRATARAGEAASRSEWFHVELERAPFGGRLASTRVRDLVGPAPLPDGRIALGQLRAVHEPDLSDHEVLSRVERRLVERSLKRALQARVHFPPSLMAGA